MSELPALRAALQDAAVQRSGRQRRLAAAGRAVAVATAVVALVYAISSIRVAGSGEELEATATPAATGAPPSLEIVRTSPLDLAPGMPDARDIVRSAGPAAAVDRAWKAPALGGTVYLIRGEDRWCLSVPDPATDHPELERGSTCTAARDFERFGIALTIGTGYVAAFAEGTPAPILRSVDGSEQRLRPLAGLVALLNLPNGSAIERPAPDGGARTDTIRVVPRLG